MGRPRLHSLLPAQPSLICCPEVLPCYCTRATQGTRTNTQSHAALRHAQCGHLRDVPKKLQCCRCNSAGAMYLLMTTCSPAILGGGAVRKGCGLHLVRRVGFCAWWRRGGGGLA